MPANCSRDLFHGLKDYRLGDSASGPYWRGHDPWRHLDDSFIKAIDRARASGISTSIESLLPLIKKRISARAPTAPNGSAVVHLRTGDVLEGASIAPVEVFLCNWTSNVIFRPRSNTSQLYVYPLRYWQAAARRVARTNLTSVVILSASHKPMADFSKSCTYIDAVAATFESRGLHVTSRLGSTPDDDIVYAATARLFVASGGTFSNFLAGVVERRGGRVIKLPEACPYAPWAPVWWHRCPPNLNRVYPYLCDRNKPYDVLPGRSCSEFCGGISFSASWSNAILGSMEKASLAEVRNFSSSSLQRAG